MLALRLTLKSLLFNFIAVEPTDHFGENVFCKRTLGLQIYNLKIYFLMNFQINVKRISFLIFYEKYSVTFTDFFWGGWGRGVIFKKNEIMKLFIVKI